MNSVSLIGRLTKDPDFKQTNETSVVHYTLAVDRYGRDADFIKCVAFGKSAEFANNYFYKGLRVGVSGSIQTGSYENKDGDKVYTTEVLVERQFFADGKEPEDNSKDAKKQRGNGKNNRRR